MNRKRRYQLKLMFHRRKKIYHKKIILSILKFWFFINILKFTACFSVGIESRERITSAIAIGEVAINQTAIRAARCIAWIHYKFIIKTSLNNIENIKYYKTTKIFIFLRIYLLRLQKVELANFFSELIIFASSKLNSLIFQWVNLLKLWKVELADLLASC